MLDLRRLFVMPLSLASKPPSILSNVIHLSKNLPSHLQGHHQEIPPITVCHTLVTLLCCGGAEGAVERSQIVRLSPNVMFAHLHII